MSTETQDFTEVKASHILVDTEAEAMNLKATIATGDQTFEQAAKAVSKCPSGSRGGDLGYFTRNQMVKEFDTVAFDPSQKIGEISEPVKTDFGWHLLLVTDRK